MSQYVTFLLVGLGAGAAYAAVALSLVVTFKGTGVINFAAGAMAAWGCYVFDELRRNGNLFFPLPFNHDSTLGDDGSYGGFPLLFFAVVSGALLYGLIHVLVRRPVRTRWPALDRPLAVGGIPYGFLAWPGEAGLFRVGDQAAVIPSLTGDGMAIALHSAAEAARTWLGGGTASEHHLRLARTLKGQMRLAGVLHGLCLGPAQGWVASAGRVAPTLLRHAASWTRLRTAA